MVVRVWPFAPDWGSEVRTSFEWLTNVQKSRSGKEQRCAMRPSPRVTLEFTTIVSEFDFRRFMSRADTDLADDVLMPDWSRPALVDIAATSGQGVISIEETDTWMRPGVDILIVHGESPQVMFQQASIASRSGSTINLSGALGADVPVGASVYRLWQGRLDANIATTMVSDRISEVRVKFTVNPGSEDLNAIGSVAAPYDGRELFMTQPDWAREVSVDFDAIIESVDFGTGKVDTYAPVDFNSRSIKLTFTSFTRAELWGIVNFARRLGGQQGEFFMPTFSEDMRLRTDAALGATRFQMVGDHLLPYAGSTVFRNIVLFMRDGSYRIFEVTDIDSTTISGQDHCRVYVSPTLTEAVDMDDVDMICWLPLWRLASDQIVVQWQTDQIGSIGLTVTTLETLDPES